MKLHIIRHAQSTNNALLDQAVRVCDPPLTALGLRQAQILAAHLATGMEPWLEIAGAHRTTRQPYQITRLYTSPMRRALQTAKAIGRTLGLRPEVLIDVHEQGGIFLDHGEGRGLVGYPGMSRQQMLAECAELVLPASVTEQGWWTGGYEEMSGCQERAARVAATLQKRAAGAQGIAIVTHGNFIDALLKILLPHPPDAEMFYYNYNTAISRLDWHGDGRVKVRYLGRVDHLPLEIIS